MKKKLSIEEKKKIYTFQGWVNFKRNLPIPSTPEEILDSENLMELSCLFVTGNITEKQAEEAYPTLYQKYVDDLVNNY
jgi:hypothetical protein